MERKIELAKIIISANFDLVSILSKHNCYTLSIVRDHYYNSGTIPPQLSVFAVKGKTRAGNGKCKDVGQCCSVPKVHTPALAHRAYR